MTEVTYIKCDECGEIDGVIKVYKRIEDPSMIQSWCPLPDEESN